MAKYTLELRTIYEDTNVKLFDFDYDLYDNNLKPIFEKKFFEYFYFDEIGQPTIQRFKHMLKSKLHMIMPYYQQLYETELRCGEVDFMLNKDLTETFVREIENSSNGNTSINSNGSNNNTNLSLHSDTPQSKLVLEIEKYMSSADKDTSNSNYNDTNTSVNSINNNGIEKTELVSKGNIGVTSSAELLRKWRSILINIDELIFKDMQDLFMQVY